MTTPPDPFAPPRAQPSPADRRTAVAALDVARPVVARMDASAPPGAIEGDMGEAWTAVETALRALLGGTALGGQALVGEARQRGLLEYAHAHALLAFHAARERVAGGQLPTSEDVVAARSAFQALEAALGVGIAANTGTFDAVRPDRAPLPGNAAYGAGYRAPAFGGERGPTAPPMRAEPPPAASLPPTANGGGDAADPWAVRPRRRFPVALVAGLVALLAVLGGVAWWAANSGDDPRAYTEGVAAYRAGQREVARAKFAEAVKDEPDHAPSHVFLARLSREDGDLTRATSELTRAIELDTTSALAFREMGQLQLQANRPDLAARFLERALKRDPRDVVALGWMGCAMARQGQAELAERFFQRAGQGDWSPCRPAAYGPPGAVPGQGVPPGGYPPGSVPPGAYPPAGAYPPQGAPPGGYAPPAAPRP